MRLWVAWELNKRDVRRWQVANHLVARTHEAHLAKLGNPVTVIVNFGVTLNIQNALHHWVGALCWELLVVQRLTRQSLFAVVKVGRANIIHHFVLVVTHLDQLPHISHLAMTNERGILERQSLTRQQQFFRWQASHMNALVSNHSLNLHIVQHRLRHLNHLTRHWVNHWLHLHCVFVRVGRNNLRLCLWLLHQNLQGLVIQP